MPQGCRALKLPEEIDDIADNLQDSKVLNALVAKFPRVGVLARAINASSDLGDSVKRTVAALFAAREERDVAVQAAMAFHNTKHKPLRAILENYDDAGLADFHAKSTGRTVRLHWHEALEGNIDRWVLSPEQHDAMQSLKDIWADARFDYNRFGGVLDEEADMFPRVVNGWLDENGNVKKGDVQQRGGGRVRVGGAFTKSRAVDDQGIFVPTTNMVNDKGWRYAEAEDALAQRVREVSLRTADLQLQDWLKRQPFVVKGRTPTSRHPGRAPAEDFGGVEGETIDIKPFMSEKVPALAGYEAPKDIAEYIEDILSRPEKLDIPVVSQLMDESRALVASFDVGTIGIQLMGALAADIGHLLPRIARKADQTIVEELGAGPTATLTTKILGGLEVRWAPSAIFPRAVIKSLPALASKSYRTKYIAENRVVVERWAPYMGGLNTSEFLEALRTESTFLPYRAFHWAEQPTSRFFATSLDVAKIEYFKALDKIYGPENLSKADMERLGAWTRNSLGQTSTNRLGMSPRQQDIESTFLFFSPRYTRSLVASIGTLRHMDKAGAEAWAGLGGMVAAGVVAYTGFAAALGQEPQLDPTKPGFLSLRVGDNYIGIGGGIKAVSSLVTRAAKDPTTLNDVDFQTNPFLKFWKNRTSPLTGTALDVMTGENALGYKIDDGTDWFKVGMDRSLPFAVQAAIDANGGIGSKETAFFANGVGLSANPMAAWDVYDKYLKDQRRADGTQRFPDGYQSVNTDENQFTEFTRHDPTAVALKENWEEQRVSRGGDSAASVRIQQERRERLAAADTMLAQTKDYAQYREQVNQIRALAREEFRSLALSDPRTTTADKQIVNSWYDLYNDPTALDPITQGIDSEGLETLQAEWKRQNPGEYERVIEPNEVLGETDNETELRVDRKAVQDAGWWETDDKAWDQIAARKPEWVDGAGNMAEYRQQSYLKYLAEAQRRGVPEPQLVAERLMERDPVVRVFEKLRSHDRLVLQRDNPSIIPILSKWGYNQTSLMEYRLAVGRRPAADTDSDIP
jgi:hypothetical protein